MSCICQYFGPLQKNMEEKNRAEISEKLNASTISEGAISATELASSRVENWLLQKKLHESEIAIENLESLVTTILEKQHQILSDLHAVRDERDELLKDCRLQREYHASERNSLLRELHDTKVTLGKRTEELQQMVANNEELMDEVERVSMRFHVYKSSHRSNCSSSPSRPVMPQFETVSNDFDGSATSLSTLSLTSLSSTDSTNMG